MRSGRVWGQCSEGGVLSVGFGKVIVLSWDSVALRKVGGAFIG